MVQRLRFLACIVLATSPGCASDARLGNGATTGGDACAFSVKKSAISPKIATVGVVEWSLAGAPPASAKIVFTLKNFAPSMTNLGGQAPVNLSKPNYRTLLLGLKQSSDYVFHIEATRDDGECISPDYALPTTGSFAAARRVTVQVDQAAKREPGFIVTSSGTTLPNSAFIIDADGEIVWYAPGPENPSRAQMDYEGDNLWMVSLNMINSGGEMRYISMDGEQEQQHVPGLELSHHDFTVLPGGKIATLVWASAEIDPESFVAVRSADGAVENLFRVGSNLYRSDAFHANAIHYNPLDESFTIADRNPNVLVKASATGTPEWQVGGLCAGAPVGNRCFPHDWQVVHGHHLLEDGTLLAFNNGFIGKSQVFEFKLDVTPTSFAAAQVKNYEGTATSFNLGDVQRLPGGNTLITYATDERIIELDADWNEVQTFSARVGYSSWRQTLYGPPPRP